MIRTRPQAHKTGTRATARWHVAAVLLVVALAVFLRLFRHSSNNDIFIDEVTYSHIARNLALGHGVTLFNGQGFYLHPPAYFYLAAAFLKVFGVPHDLLGTVLALRILNGALGGLEVLCLVILVSRVLNRRWALGTGLIAALDPFILLWDGRALLETQAITAALLGWCLISVAAAPRDPATATTRNKLPDRRTAVIAAVSGLCFGLSVLTKETYAFVGVVPLTVIVILGWPMRRMTALVALVAAAACFIAYFLTLLVNGDVAAWWSQQTSGLRRAFGAEQISGFNQAGHASFASRVLSDSSLFLGSYIIIALIAAALLLELRLLWLRYRAHETTSPAEAMMFLFAAGAATYVAYAVLFGAFEEQIFYLFEVAGLPLLVLTTQRLLLSRDRVRRRVVAVLVVAIAGYGITVDAVVRSTSQTSLVDLHNYVADHLARRAVVDPTDGLSEYLLDTRVIVLETSVAGLRRTNVRYVVINRALDQQGYVTLAPGFIPFLKRAGTVIFRERDRDNGALLLYELVRPADQLDASGRPLK